MAICHEMPCHQTIALPDGVLLAPDFMAQLLGQTTHNVFTYAQMAAALSFLQRWNVFALTIFVNFGSSGLTSTPFWARKFTSQFCIKRLRRLSTTKLIKFDKVTFIHHSLSNSSYLLNLFIFHIIRCHRAVVERGIGLAQLYSSSLTMGRFLENST